MFTVPVALAIVRPWLLFALGLLCLLASRVGCFGHALPLCGDFQPAGLVVIPFWSFGLANDISSACWNGTSAALSKLNNKSKATTLLPGRLSKHKGIERLGDDLAGLKHLP
jgi:hypothetical protein